MAERKGPGGEEAGHDPVESGQQEDHTHVAGERDDEIPVDATLGEGTELIENHRGSDSAESGTDEEPEPVEPEGDPDTEDTESSTAESASSEAEQSDAVTDDVEPVTAADVRVTSAVDSSDEVPDVPSSGDVLAFRPRGNAAEHDDTRQAAAEGIVDLEEIGDEPVDLSELLADDELLDALSGTDPDVGSGASGTDGPDLESLLVAWRQDVDAAPIGELVDADTAVSAIAEGTRPRRRLKRRHLVPVASAAAVLMIAFTGVGLAARDAQPGDALWGVAQVLYIDHARAAQARHAVEGDLQFAEGAWDQGNRSAAEAALERAREQMEAVDSDHGLDELEAAHASLTAKFEEHEGTTESSTTEQTSTSEETVTSTPPPPPQPPLPPQPPPDTTSSQPPSSSTEPSESTSAPSETSGSSDDNPSSGPWGSNDNPFLPPDR